MRLRNVEDRDERNKKKARLNHLADNPFQDVTDMIMANETAVLMGAPIDSGKLLSTPAENPFHDVTVVPVSNQSINHSREQVDSAVNPFLDITDMALSNEFTGLMSTPDKDEEKRESFFDMLNPDSVQDR